MFGIAPSMLSSDFAPCRNAIICIGRLTLETVVIWEMVCYTYMLIMWGWSLSHGRASRQLQCVSCAVQQSQSYTSEVIWRDTQ